MFYGGITRFSNEIAAIAYEEMERIACAVPYAEANGRALAAIRGSGKTPDVGPRTTATGAGEAPFATTGHGLSCERAGDVPKQTTVVSRGAGMSFCLTGAERKCA